MKKPLSALPKPRRQMKNSRCKAMKKPVTIITLLLLFMLYTDCNKMVAMGQGIDISCGVNIIRNCNHKSCSSLCRQYVQSDGHCIKNRRPPPDQYCNCDC